MRQAISLKVIELLPSGRLAITLAADPNDWGGLIYRAAAEISWEPELLRFVSPRPELGPPSKHFSHVARAAADELGYVLTPTDVTRWINVPPAERAEIERLSHAAS